MKILWYSRHHPLDKQLEELRRIFGEDIEVITEHSRFVGAEEIVNKMKTVQADELVLVAPLAVCQAVLNLGIRPIRSKMREVPRHVAQQRGYSSVNSDHGRYYRFDKFIRLESIDMKYSELG